MCATPSPTIVTVTETANPPKALLEPCKRPEKMPLETNRDLARLASELLYAFDVCASQIDALRVYFGVSDAQDKDKSDK